MARGRKKRLPTLAQRGARADAAVAAAKRSVPIAVAAGALARTPVSMKTKGGRGVAMRGSNKVAVGVAMGTVAYSANRARRRTAAKQGYRPIGYRGPVGGRLPARRRSGRHHASVQRRDRYGRFA